MTEKGELMTRGNAVRFDRPAMDVLELLNVKAVDQDLFRADAVFDDRYALTAAASSSQANFSLAAVRRVGTCSVGTSRGS